MAKTSDSSNSKPTSIAAAKKAGSLYYYKNGKKMAAVLKSDLKGGESLRQYMNRMTSKTAKKSPPPNKKKDSKPVDTITPTGLRSGSKRATSGPDVSAKGLRGAKDRVGSGLSMSSKDFRKAPSRVGADDFTTMKESSAATKNRQASQRLNPAKTPDYKRMASMSDKMEDEMKLPTLAKGGVAKKPVKKNMGGMMKYNKGGKVRGCGMAKQGTRPAKMVVMKGS